MRLEFVFPVPVALLVFVVEPTTVINLGLGLVVTLTTIYCDSIIVVVPGFTCTHCCARHSGKGRVWELICVLEDKSAMLASFLFTILEAIHLYWRLVLS